MFLFCLLLIIGGLKGRLCTQPSSLIFPLDVAAHAGLLIRTDRLAGQNIVERGPDILAGDGNFITGPRVVELAAIDQFQAIVKNKKIGGAGGLVSLGNLAVCSWLTTPVGAENRPRAPLIA
jgi:hypothetical protein